ncbi:MAG: DNA polymerase I [Patescibacteria group bacterium]
MSQKQQTKALIIDANALLHRAWHALPPLTAPGGQVVNAVYGFTSVLLKILQAEKPDYLAVCWDTAAPTFRHEMAPEYKAQREEQPQAFYDQVAPTKDVVEVLGGSNIELDGYEADDLLATIAKILAANDTDVTILTSDRDMFQAIGQRINVMSFKKGVSETVVYDEKTLVEILGLTPDQMVDFKSLRGDASDNLKGVTGIGEKTATDLVKRFKNLKGIFKAAHNEKSDLTKSVREKLLNGEKDAMRTHALVKLMSDAPIKVKIKDLVRHPIDDNEVKQLLLRFGFKTLLARFLGQTTNEKKIPGPSKTKDVEKNPGEIVEKKLNHLESQHVGKPTIDKALEYLDQAVKQKLAIVRPVFAPQASLFADIPVIALGLEKITVLLSTSHLQDKKIVMALRDLLTREEIKKTGHGLKDFWHWAKFGGYEARGLFFDTEIASYLLAAGEGGHDLPSLAAARLGRVIADDENKPLHEVDAIRDLATVLSRELAERKLEHFMARFETPLIPVMALMEDAGIAIDRPYFKKLADDFREVKNRLEKEMVELAGEAFNPASPQQLGHVLFEVLEIPTKGIKRGKTGISTAAPELEKLEGIHPIIEKISEFREVAKLLSTYVEAIPNLADAEDRVHTTYNQAVTSTGRLSSTNPNLQNIPIRTELGRKIRRGFIAPKGSVLLSCDYSQIELRVVAALAKDKKMLEAFNSGTDIHIATAAAIWDIPLDKVTKDQRRSAKAINFGIIYGQGPQGLAKSAGIRFDEAKRFIDEYFHAYSGLREYLENTKALAHAQGYVETLFGRRRPMADINSPRPEIRAAAERMAINMPVQGTSADLIKLAMINISKVLPQISEKTRMLLQVHDELVFEVPAEEVKKVAPKIVDLMQNVEKIGVPLVVDAKFGKNWDEMEKT